MLSQPEVSNSANGQNPIYTLLNEFDSQQELLYSLVSVVERVGHRISNTDYPQPDPSAMNKESQPQLPFNEGHLMELYTKIQSNKKLIDRLQIHVHKIDSLI